MNEKVNMQNLIDSLADKHNLSKKEAEVFVREFFCLLEQGLEKDRYVKVKGLGTFKLINVESRESVNVNTGERFQIQGHTKVSFVPDNALRDVINKPFAHFETVVLNEGAVLPEQVAPEDAEEGTPDNPYEAIEAAFAAEKPQQSLADAIIANELAGAGKKIVAAPVTPLQPAVSEPVDEIIADTLAVAKEKETSDEVAKPEASLDEEAEISVITPAQPEEEPQAAEPELFAVPLSTTPHERWSFTHTWITIIVVILLASAGIVAYLYFPDIFSSEEEVKPVVEQQPVELPQVAPVDSVALTSAEATIEPATEVEASQITVRTEVVPATQPAKPIAEPASKPVVASATSAVQAPQGYRIDGVQTIHTVASGETLRLISLKYYDTRSYSTFLALYNSDVLENPDALSPGIKLKIPKLVKQ